MTRSLSRINIIGNLHNEIPLCVLLEIADAHGIEFTEEDTPDFYDRLLESIRTTQIPSIDENKIDWSLVARYVNSKVTWNLKSLNEAYNFLQSFIHRQAETPNLSDIGRQTPEKPRSINACVLYRLCLNNHLRTFRWTSLEQMVSLLSSLNESIDSLQRKVDIFLKSQLSKHDLINILSLSKSSISDPLVKISASELDTLPFMRPNQEALLMRCYTSLHQVKTLQNLVTPKTIEGAISLAAILYNIDISRAKDPITEYLALKTEGKEKYRPSDPWMEHWYRQNTNMFDLTSVFNPGFPPIFYSNLHDLVKKYGNSSSEILRTNLYELLQMNYVENSFHLGPLPNMRSKQTLISLDNLEDIPYGELLCYGPQEGPLYPVSIDELIDLFMANQNFTNPFEKDSIFSLHAIERLINLIDERSKPIFHLTLDVSTLRKRQRLFGIIRHIKATIANLDPISQQLVLNYQNSSTEKKSLIRNALYKLLYLGMYMRGWSGSGSYPILSKDTIIPPDRQGYVDIMVSKGIAAYEEAIFSLSDVGSLIQQLPLVRSREGTYVLSNNVNDGLTIGDRIKILKGGDDSDNMASCIRLTSNWLCVSAHRYLKILGLPEPFSLNDLAHIS